MHRWLILCALAGCIHDDLVTCGDQVCPAGSLCDATNDRCADRSGLSIPPDLIDLQVACGGTSSAMVPFHNASNRTINFSVAATVPGITPSPTVGTLEPGEDVAIQLTAVSPSESIPGMPATGNLLVAVDGDQLLGRDLQLTTHGALITTLEQTVDFGESSLPANPIVHTFDVINSGDEDATLTPIAPAAPYALASAQTIAIPANTMQPVAVSFQPLDGTFTADLGLMFSANTCQAPPSSIALSGAGTGEPILVDHLVLDYGSADCASPMAAQLPLTFTNEAATQQALTFSLAGMDTFLFNPGAGPTLPAGPSMSTVNVTRFALGPPLSTGTITATLSVNAPALSGPTLVTLLQNVVAPALSLSTTELTFGSIAESGGGAQQTVTITNTGNALATVTVVPPQTVFPGNSVVSFSPSAFQIPAGGHAVGTVTVLGGTQQLLAQGTGFTFVTHGSCIGNPNVTVGFSVQ